jgi:coproporphyrinogen III oxidase
MQRIKAQDATAQKAEALITHLQDYFVHKLNALSKEIGEDKPFEPVEWFRAGGKFGGGVRYVAQDTVLFNRGSVNMSQVQYESDESKQLNSATALSTIIHPKNPHAPSVHMHISWTQMKDGRGYWRMMADLNPSICKEEDTQRFEQCLQESSGVLFDEAKAQGEKYFYIPALGRHRGVSHFYLENFNSGNAPADAALARTLGEKVVDTYISIIKSRITEHKTYTQEDKDQQLAYHTLYLFQVLTLDRGTTSGLLVHDENDVGIMGSIPSHVDRTLLLSWKERTPAEQECLVEALATCLDESGVVEDTQKAALAKTAREFYKSHPKALKVQASGHVAVPTVQNHK